MTKILNITAYLFVLMLLFGCKLSEQATDLTKLVKSNTIAINNLNKELVAKDISNSINNLNKETKQLLVTKKGLENESGIEKLYTIDYIDSLRNLLITQKEVKIDEAELFLLDYLTQEKTLDTIVMSYLNLKTPTDGSVTSFTYDVLAGDEIIFNLQNGKHKIKTIEFIEGEMVRMRLMNIKRKKKVDGAFRVMSDNKLILNISNPGFLRNKGVFASNLTLVLKKPIKRKGTSIEFVNDTTFVTKMVNELITDTIYKIEDTKAFRLEPTLNITQSNAFTFPIIISSTDRLLGWGYWFGTSNSDKEIYDSYANADGEALITFAKEELLETKSGLKMPAYTGADLSISILNQSLDARTAHFDRNFAFYKSDLLVVRPSKKAEVRLMNKSTIYDFPINYRLVTVSSIQTNKMVEKTVPVIHKSIKIQLYKND